MSSISQCRQKNPTSHCGAGMVMAINSIESGPRNFQAFKNLAMQLNGTSAAASAPTSTPNGATSLRVGGALTVVLAVVISALL